MQSDSRLLLDYSRESIFPLYLHVSLLRDPGLTLGRGLDAIALVLVWLFVPGTERQVSNVTMEEMNYVFGVQTKRHIHYQVHDVAPWFVDHYLLRRKVERPEPLYRYAM